MSERGQSGTKRALVTGASNGLGKSIALQLTEAGYEVVAVDSDERGLLRLHHDSLDSIIGFKLDLADIDELQAGMRRLVAEGPYERVFLVAGISATGRFENIPAEAHKRVMRVNLLAPQIIATWLLQERMLNRGARVMFISSLSHVLGYPGAASYAASKDALAIYARSIRKSFRKHGALVCCCFPGAIRTDHAEKHSPKGANEAGRTAPAIMARKIITAADRGIPEYYPEFRGRLASLVGRLAPRWTTARVRKHIFEKLDGEVY